MGSARRKLVGEGKRGPESKTVTRPVGKNRPLRSKISFVSINEVALKKKSSEENLEGKLIREKTQKVNLFEKFEDDEFEKMKKKCSYKFLESCFFQIYISVITIYALYGEDLRVIFFPKLLDPLFNYVTIICMISFSLEIILASAAKPQYICGFFFWLDVISTVSMLLDITWVSSQIFQSSDINFVQFSKVGRASKVGSRAGRVVRIIRLIRLLRMVKLYKQAKKAKDKKLDAHNEATLDVIDFWRKSIKRKRVREEFFERYSKRLANPRSIAALDRFRKIVEAKVIPKIRGKLKERRRHFSLNLSGLKSKIRSFKTNTILPLEKAKKDKNFIQKFYGIEPEDTDGSFNSLMPKQSRVGRQLTHRTTKKLVIIMLSLLFLLPLFSASYYAPVDHAGDFDISTMATLFENSVNSTRSMENWKNQEFPELFQEYNKSYNEKNQKIIKYSDPSYNFEEPVYADLRDDDIDTYLIDVETVLGAGKVSFTISSRVENLLTSILNIIRTTFICVVLGVVIFLLGRDTNDLILLPIERMMVKVNKMAKNPSFVRNEILVEQKKNSAEVGEIENAILKIGTLLMVVFGPAGAKIIANNVIEEGDLNPMLPGNKTYCIFGFCDIRNFTNATEILEEEVMVYVNEIAEIIHTTVHNYVGSSNKNIGDAFLLVWRTPSDSVIEYPDGRVEVVQYKRQVESLMDVSLISILLMISRIEVSPKLQKYSNNKRLCQRMPNYKVTLGYGLHCGWAIEGALGSYYKIDVTYLGQHVDIAMKLEEQTKAYKSMILLTSSIHSLMSPKIKKICRMIDKIKFKGQERPLGLYTVDLSLSSLDKANNLRATNLTNKRKKIVNTFIIGNKSTFDIIRGDREVKKLVWTNEDFRYTHKQALRNYIIGEWQIAKIYLMKTLQIKKDDGPSICLLKRIHSLEYQSPKNWAGYWVEE